MQFHRMNFWVSCIWSVKHITCLHCWFCFWKEGHLEAWLNLPSWILCLTEHPTAYSSLLNVVSTEWSIIYWFTMILNKVLNRLDTMSLFDKDCKVQLMWLALKGTIKLRLTKYVYCVLLKGGCCTQQRKPIWLVTSCG